MVSGAQWHSSEMMELKLWSPVLVQTEHRPEPGSTPKVKGMMIQGWQQEKYGGINDKL
jgi:hypothetical protein